MAQALFLVVVCIEHGLLLVHADVVNPGFKNDVQIQGSDKEIFRNRTVRVLEWNSLCRGFVNTQREVMLDTEGFANLQLPTGRYVFEILEQIDSSTCLVVRSATKAVTSKGNNLVLLRCEEPHNFFLSYGGEVLSIKAARLRSRAIEGFLTLKPEHGVDGIRVMMSPDQEYRIALHAEKATTTALINTEINSRTASELKADTANAINFKLRAHTPDIDKAEIWFGFPEQWVPIIYTEQSVLLTTRRQLLMNYTLTFPDGTKAVLERRPYNLKRTNTFEIGGELYPQGWAALLYEETISGWEPYLRYDLGVVDTSGHVLDERRSTIHFKKTFQAKDGRPLPTERLDESQKEFFSKPYSAIAMGLDWWWGIPRSDVVHPEGLHEVSSMHYSIECPNTYRWQCANYLMMLERCFDICRVLTNRRGPTTVNVDWRYSPGGAAKASIGNAAGGQRNLWMSLPFNGLQYCWSQFSEAANGGGNPYVIHENLHLFGYNHGDEMAKIEGQGEKIYPLMKWWLIDHPNFQLPYSIPK